MGKTITIYPDHWLSRKKRVHTVHAKEGDDWSYHPELQDAFRAALTRGSTSIVICGIDRWYRIEIVDQGTTDGGP